MSKSSTPDPEPQPLDLDRAKELLERAERFLSRAQVDVRRALESDDPRALFDALRELDEMVGPALHEHDDPEGSSERRRSA